MGMSDDKTGFDKLELDDVRELTDQGFKDHFGEDAPVDDAHHMGQLSGVMAARGEDVEELAQTVRNANSILRGRNQDLDILGADEAVNRKPATSATVYLQIDADVGTIIPAGTEYSTGEEVIFNTLDDVAVGEVATIKGDDGKDVPLTDDDGNELGRVTVQAQADEPGSTGNVGANTITGEESSDGIEGVMRVTNPEPSSGGADIESEVDYRARLMTNHLAKSDSTEDGMTAKVDNVAGVIQCKVTANNELTTDAAGNPPKTTHFYVIGGADQDVADAIFHSIALPGHTYGEVSKTVLNHSGQERTVYFSRAKLQTVYVRIHIKTDDGYDSDNGIANLKNQVLAYDHTLTMGDSLLYSKLFEYLWQVSGITSINLTVGTDKTKLALGNVTVDEYSLAYITSDDIEVILDD